MARKSKLQNKVKTIEALVLEGNIARARIELQSINTATIPRELAQPLASLSRTCGNWKLALRLLAPYAGPRRALNHKPTVSESCTYAGALNRAGARSEALSNKNPLNPSDC